MANPPLRQAGELCVGFVNKVATLAAGPIVTLEFCYRDELFLAVDTPDGHRETAIISPGPFCLSLRHVVSTRTTKTLKNFNTQMLIH
jgi:hypothetical protein